MQLASIHFDGADRIGARIDDDSLVDLGDAMPAVGGNPPSDMLALLESGPAAMDDVRAALAHAGRNPGQVPRIPLSAVRWHPPVRNPGKICGVAMNNSASNARKISAPDHPAFFLKPASCLIGHEQPVHIRRYYGSVHPEPELAAVIGRRMRDVDAVDALDGVAGYTIFNDITGNGMRAEDRFHYWAVYAVADDPGRTQRVEQHLSYAGRYKGCDGFGVMGPWLVTADEIGNPNALDVRCEVGGEIVAADSTRYYNYRVEEVLSFISQFHTLHPGDVVSFGTAFRPVPGQRSIHQADFQRVTGPVVVSIEGLGTQTNPIATDDRPIGNWRLE